ncbi:MAG TPA: LacI family DNA-binding transcriptional regulator [Alphaproteobacteria bacterium]|nr:LacI family DNA-binding transcriptional regulator [Alphaproteobacteria bacterium]
MTDRKTIAGIARLAGVGTATVDRVINRRPGVSPETAQRVLEVMREAGTETPVRGRPKKTAGYRMAFVLPSARTPLFDMIDRQIAQAAGEFRHQHITEVTYRFDAGDTVKFASELGKLGECDGVVLLAPDLPAIKLAVNELVRSGTQVVTLLSDIAGSMRAAYVGADNRAAGRTAGLLLGRVVGHRRAAKVLLTSQATRYSSEIDRRVGFVQLLEERFPNIEVVRVQDLPENETEAREACAALLAQPGLRGELAGFYNVGACTYGVARACQEAGADPDFIAIGHDLTEANKTLLTTGVLSFVLHQDIHDCVTAAATSLLTLRASLRGAPIAVPPRLEIVTSENLV